MVTIELIFKIIFFFINCFCLCIVCIMVSKWHRRMEDKLDNLIRTTVSDKILSNIIYVNQLEIIKSKLVEEERYEEADKINKLIEDEFNNLKMYGNKKRGK